MSPPSEYSHRKALLLSTLLTLVGSCGACNGANQFAERSTPTAGMVQVDQSPGAAETAELLSEFAITYNDAPNRRPMGLANSVLSMMLIIGSFMLGSRRKSTVWFLSNALAANMLYIVVDAAMLIERVQSRSYVLSRKLGALAVAQAPPEQTLALPEAIVQAKVAILLGCIGIGALALFKFGFHAMLFMRTRGAEVKEFLESDPLR